MALRVNEALLRGIRLNRNKRKSDRSGTIEARWIRITGIYNLSLVTMQCRGSPWPIMQAVWRVILCLTGSLDAL